jgi:hypothetical protein
MFESTGWLLEEPEVNDSSKFDMIFPTVVKPPSSASVPQSVEDIEVIWHWTLTLWRRKWTIVNAQCDAEKTECLRKSPPRTCTVTSGHLNAGFFAEYTGHLIPAPKGNKLKQSCGIPSNLLTTECLHFNFLMNVMLSLATESHFPAFICQKY